MINYCGMCPHNGNAILTSYPPKIRCELTGKLHYTTDACGVDMVAVVRCKDCIHYIRNIPCVGGYYNGCEMIEGRDGNEYEINNESFYCERGERKEDAEEE